MPTRMQNAARAATIAKGRRHRAQTVESSEMGMSKADAAERIGLSLGGLNGLLYREFGTQTWPIAGHEPQPATEQARA